MPRPSSSRPIEALLLLAPAFALAEGPIADPETGLDGWRHEDATVSVTLNQRLPDQSRAYFMGRGFGAEAAESIAQGCVFQTIIRNPAQAQGALEIDIGEWRVNRGGAPPRPLKLERDWQQEWTTMGASQAARIAFRYSLFPTTQRFEPGDWNMGMVTMALPPGERFDLELKWHAGGGLRSAILRGMTCAPDRPAPPESP